MAVNHVAYRKNFISKTDSEDIAPHGSPQFEDFQTLGDDDRNLRENLFKTYSYNYENRGERFFDTSTKYHDRKGFGFDGSQVYSFAIDGQPTTSPKDTSKNVQYEVEVKITKSGNSKTIKKPSDLELFLLNNAFKRI